MRARVFAFALALAGAASLHACRRAEERPDKAYAAFAQALADRDGDRAWTLLSSDTRAWLDARARAVAAAAPGVVPASGRALLLGDASLPSRPAADPVVLREGRDRAVVSVADEAGARGEVELVLEGGAWRVKVPPPP